MEIHWKIETTTNPDRRTSQQIESNGKSCSGKKLMFSFYGHLSELFNCLKLAFSRIVHNRHNTSFGQILRIARKILNHSQKKVENISVVRTTEQAM